MNQSPGAGGDKGFPFLQIRKNASHIWRMRSFCVQLKGTGSRFYKSGNENGLLLTLNKAKSCYMICVLTW